MCETIMANISGAYYDGLFCILLIVCAHVVIAKNDEAKPGRFERETTTKIDSANNTSINATTLALVPMKPVIPLNENKTSNIKQKLINQSNINAKKIDFTADQLLGVNGTGQRKDTTTIASPIISSSTTTSQSKMNSTTTETPIFEDNINIDTVDKSDSEANSTLLKHNITQSDEDYHLYYNSTLIVDDGASNLYWKKLGNLNVSNLLSNSYRRATTVLLSFDFPYYGLPIRNITIATGGFLYTGDYVHSWLASTQFIAPLMANFDTSLSNNSYVKYKDDGNAFYVVWENVSLQDRPGIPPFTFSATLNKTGDITFAYLRIPIDIQLIHDAYHPVKVGLSDAYIIDKTIVRTKQKTIYEYHRVNFGSQHVQNHTIITLKAQPTCFSLKDCHSCLQKNFSFKCIWCPTLNRCSTGVERKRQDWIQKGCDKTQISEATVCPAFGQKGNNPNADVTTENSDIYHTNGTDLSHDYESKHEVKINTADDHVNKIKYDAHIDNASSSSVLVAVLIIITLLLGCAFWILYAYRNPHTKSGQLLIRYRPNKWSWRRGEARYTAATIHM